MTRGTGKIHVKVESIEHADGTFSLLITLDGIHSEKTIQWIEGSIRQAIIKNGADIEWLM